MLGPHVIGDIASGSMFSERAYAKLNLVLHVGGVRPDGLHELCSLFASLELADDVDGEPNGLGEDSVECPGVAGRNLALAALEAYRSRVGGELPPIGLRIEKRIPIAAGLGGGSADAAAALRVANAVAGSPLTADQLRELAASIGSDVPSQVEPAHALVEGAGELVEGVTLPPLAVLLVPATEGLATADVYRELDRLGGARERLDPGPLRRLSTATPGEVAAAVENDLEPAALSLRPELAGTLERIRATRALAAAVSGSGPTCFGLYERGEEAAAAAASLPGAIVTALRALPAP